MNFLVYAFQDLKKQKVKSMFAIGGVFISILLLTVVGSLSDSMSYSYLDQATAQVGSADFMFSKVLEADINFDPFFEESLIQDRLQNNISEIDYYFPRILMLVQVSHYNDLVNATISRQIIFYGLNSVLEQESGRMGNLYLVDENLQTTDQVYEGPIPAGHCIVTKSMAKLYNLKVGDTISTTYNVNQTNLIVDAIVEQDLRFSLIESTLVITELHWAQGFLNQPGKVNYVMATLKDREYIYDTRNIDNTIRQLRLIGEKIQDRIGFEYTVTLPKMTQLSVSQQTSMMMTITFSFITFFSMMITGILINSILMTNIEERIREFGILRVLGAKKSFTFKMVISSGFFIALIGTLAGTFVGAIIAPQVLTWYYARFNMFSIPIQFIILPETILKSLVIGITITTLISIFPAMKAGKRVIAHAIDPTRKSAESEYVLKKEGGANGKLMALGLGISTIGIVIFLIFPRIIALGDMMLMNTLFMALLLFVLVGLVLACIGFVPVLEKIIAYMFKPFTKRYFPVYKLSLTRYQRRNNGNIIMFAMTFSFIFFISTILQMRTASAETLFEFQYGADLVLSNDGTPQDGNAVDQKLLEELQQIPGIRTVAPILHNTLDVAKAGAMLVDITEQGVNFNDIDFNSIYGTIPKLEARIGDVGDFYDYPASLIGINESYYDTIDKSLLMWDEQSGSSDDSLKTLFNSDNTCIIAKVFADAMGITKLGSKIRITMWDPENQSVGNISVFTVVGISRGMPGVWNFRSSQMNLWIGAGILVNLEDYTKLMQWGSLSDPNLVIDKILINLVNNDYEHMKEMQTYLRDYFGQNYKFVLDEAVSKINLIKQSDETMNQVMVSVLFFSIVISLFGLISSMYSTLIERMFEIGILRAMGLKPYEVRSMMMAESLTIMLAAGTLGTFIGIFIAYILQSNIAIITEMPTNLVIDIPTLLLTYISSIIISIIGMWAITRKVKKWSIVEILRWTF